MSLLRLSPVLLLAVILGWLSSPLKQLSTKEALKSLLIGLSILVGASVPLAGVQLSMIALSIPWRPLQSLVECLVIFGILPEQVPWAPATADRVTLDQWWTLATFLGIAAAMTWGLGRFRRQRAPDSWRGFVSWTDEEPGGAGYVEGVHASGENIYLHVRLHYRSVPGDPNTWEEYGPGHGPVRQKNALAVDYWRAKNGASDSPTDFPEFDGEDRFRAEKRIIPHGVGTPVIENVELEVIRSRQPLPRSSERYNLVSYFDTQRSFLGRHEIYHLEPGDRLLIRAHFRWSARSWNGRIKLADWELKHEIPDYPTPSDLRGRDFGKVVVPPVPPAVKLRQHKQQVQRAKSAQRLISVVPSNGHLMADLFILDNRTVELKVAIWPEAVEQFIKEQIEGERR